MDKNDRIEQWARRKAKHHNDHNNGKCGFVGGNVRYQRTDPDGPGNRTMGKARASRF